jgi:hypothetical protein
LGPFKQQDFSYINAGFWLEKFAKRKEQFEAEFGFDN